MNKNLLSNTKQLIEQLEDPLVEVKDVLKELDKLDISDENKEILLRRLKYLGEIFEPRKNKLKTLY